MATHKSICTSKNKDIPRIGSRAKVFHGNAEMTSGGLRRSDLFKDASGHIRSRVRSSLQISRNKELELDFLPSTCKTTTNNGDSIR
jgi:hypothetical protein